MDQDAPLLIGKAHANAEPGAPEFWAAQLYRHPDGTTYLLAGTGGQDSEFAASEPDAKGRVIEMTETEAYNWAASYLPIDTVEEFFDHLTEEI